MFVLCPVKGQNGIHKTLVAGIDYPTYKKYIGRNQWNTNNNRFKWYFFNKTQSMSLFVGFAYLNCIIAQRMKNAYYETRSRIVLCIDREDEWNSKTTLKCLCLFGRFQIHFPTVKSLIMDCSFWCEINCINNT